MESREKSWVSTRVRKRTQLWLEGQQGPRGGQRPTFHRVGLERKGQLSCSVSEAFENEMGRCQSPSRWKMVRTWPAGGHRQCLVLAGWPFGEVSQKKVVLLSEAFGSGFTSLHAKIPEFLRHMGEVQVYVPRQAPVTERVVIWARLCSDRWSLVTL